MGHAAVGHDLCESYVASHFSVLLVYSCVLVVFVSALIGFFTSRIVPLIAGIGHYEF